MKNSPIKRISATAMALLMLLLAGCGSSNTGAQTQSTTTDTQTSGKAIRMTAAFASAFDPACADDSASCTAVVNMYDSLVYPDLDGTLINGLADSYTISKDNLTYTFKLKQGATFHDGSPVEASDVAFSYQRLMAIGQGYAYLFESYVKSVVATDASTVTITLNKPFAPFLNILCRLYVVNQDVVMANKQNGDYGEYGDYGMAYLAQNDAGSGPYYCKSYTMNDRIVMAKYDKYYGTFAENAPDTVELISGTETATVRTMMANGQLEISDMWQTAEAYEALAKIPGVTVKSFGSGQILYLMTNTKKAPTDDVHVRKALAYLVDYNQVLQNLFPGYLAVNNYVGDSLLGSKETFQKYGYDLDKAKQELAASKYADQLKNGQMQVEIAWISDVPDEEKLALLVQSAAAQIGLTVKVTKVAWATQVQNVANVNSTANVGVCYMSPDYNEAGSLLYQRLHSDTSGTWQQMEWLQDSTLDSKIETALSTMNTDQRYALYGEIQNEALEQVYGIPVVEQGEKHAYVSYIHFPAMEKGTASSTLGYNFLFKDFQVVNH